MDREYSLPKESVLEKLETTENGLSSAQAAERLEKALDQCGVAVTGDKNGATCNAYTDALLSLL